MCIYLCYNKHLKIIDFKLIIIKKGLIMEATPLLGSQTRNEVHYGGPLDGPVVYQEGENITNAGCWEAMKKVGRAIKDFFSWVGSLFTCCFRGDAA